MGFALVVAKGSYFVLRLLTNVTSLVAEHKLSGMRTSLVETRGLSSCGSQTLENRLSNRGVWVSCSTAHGVFPD